jgi:hypothetical protein
MDTQPRTLLAVLANAPLTTSGDRTRHRVLTACEVIGCQTFEIANLLTVATPTVVDISVVGGDPTRWVAARGHIQRGIDRADEILLGWGCTEPAGVARQHHRAQLKWLAATIAELNRDVWMVGDTPRHPSRWQRYTASEYPGVPFRDALSRSLRRHDQVPRVRDSRKIDA